MDAEIREALRDSGLMGSAFNRHPVCGGPEGLSLWQLCNMFGVRPQLIIRAVARRHFPQAAFPTPRCPRWSVWWVHDWLELPGSFPWRKQ